MVFLISNKMMFVDVTFVLIVVKGPAIYEKSFISIKKTMRYFINPWYETFLRKEFLHLLCLADGKIKETLITPLEVHLLSWRNY